MSKKGLVALLIIPIVALLALNSAFILRETNSNKISNEKSILILTNSDYEEADDYPDVEDEKEIPIPQGSELEKASAVALAYIGGGTVTDTEIGDEEGYYEIEITLHNGDQVDVHLDKNFKILSTEWED